MTSKREQILDRLNTKMKALESATVKVYRNLDKPQKITSGGIIILRDGGGEEPEVLLSPLTYIYEHLVTAEIMVQNPDPALRDSTLDALLVSIGNVINANRTLDGLAEWVEARSPDFQEESIEGAASVTDHTDDLTFSSQLYKAATGFSPTSVETKDKFSVDNLDVAGILDAAAITEADIMAGKYDFAEIEIFMVNVTDLSQGSITHRRGWLGEVSLKNGQFVAEVRGLAQKLQQNIVELYSPTCRAVFGDTRCKANLASYTVGGAVDTVSSRQVFISNSMAQAAGYFSSGEVVWLTGANAGRRMEIKEFSNKQFTLVLPMPNNVTVGDTFNAIAGCDKTISTCVAKFNNAVNFRGEPYVPGMDKMLATSATSNDLQHV